MTETTTMRTSTTRSTTDARAIGDTPGRRLSSSRSRISISTPAETHRTQGVVQLEISIEKLESLFANGDLCVADFRCLDHESKAAVWSLCLTSCSNRMHCDFAGLGSCHDCVQPSGHWHIKSQ